MKTSIKLKNHLNKTTLCQEDRNFFASILKDIRGLERTNYYAGWSEEDLETWDMFIEEVSPK